MAVANPPVASVARFTETTTPLAGNGVFTGPARALGDSSIFRFFALTDQAGTLHIEGSLDGATNWRDYAAGGLAVGAGAPATGWYDTYHPFMRARYVNGAVAQASLELVTNVTSNNS